MKRTKKEKTEIPKETPREKWKRFVGTEVGIEYKACLYFYCLLFFYCCYLVLQKTYTASILHMAEMIFTAYVIGYIQVYLFGNYDEAEHFGKKETAGAVICTLIYTGVSYWLGWFDRKPIVTVIFMLYFLFAGFCAFLVNRIKREVDTKQLNELLDAYKEEDEDGKSD